MKNSGDTVIDFSKRGKALIGQKMFEILDQAYAIEKKGNKVYHLELGEPSSYPPGRIINKTINSLLETHVGYTSSGGLYAFRESLISYFSKRHGRNFSVANIAVSPANLLITQILDILCDPNDGVGFFLPAFPTYFASANYVQCKLKTVMLSEKNKFIPTYHDIDMLFSKKPKLIILNSGNNPTGAVYPEKILAYICRRAAEGKVWILSDETYGMLSYGKKYHSLADTDYERIILISSFSKIFSIPGYRVGFVIASEEIIRKVILSNSTLYSCLPQFIQEGALAGIGIIDEFTDFMRKHYRRMLNKCIKILKTASALSFSVPDSAFYIFLNVSKTGLTGDDFADQLLREKKVAVTPGSSFGIKQYIRLSFCGKERDVLTGLKYITDFANERKGV